MKIKLFLDEDVHFGLASALQKRGYDAVHVSGLNLKGKADEEQLRYAAELERCLFSFNVRDFIILHYEWLQHGHEHFGIIVSKQFPIAQTFSSLLKKLQCLSQESMKNHIEFL
ncbi:MAG: hypothetical protein BWK80_46325 [Desulfobacteraceae bacterium IS3]|nr:MAG: hypothetical protein BWK80_46325 [Desulfobacteraceae bacterium IS3]